MSWLSSLSPVVTFRTVFFCSSRSLHWPRRKIPAVLHTPRNQLPLQTSELFRCYEPGTSCRSCLGMSSLSRRKVSLKIPSSSPKLSCTDESSENTPEQHGGSLQTRFIESMRAHVITIYMVNVQGDHNIDVFCWAKFQKNL